MSRTLRQAKADPRFVAAYAHTDLAGKTTAMKLRFAGEDGKKTFTWFGNKNCTEVYEGLPEGIQRHVYRARDVAEAIEAGGDVWLHEGEKAAVAAQAAGWPGVHTATMDGASLFADWAADELRGGRITVVVDRDEPGERWARLVATSLMGKAKLRFVQAPQGLGPKADAYDCVQEGVGPDQLVPRPDLDALTVHPAVALLGLANPGETFDVAYDYVWEPWLIRGKLTLLEGKGAMGKTSLALAIAACLSNGVVPATTERREPARTLFIGAGEDDDAEVRTVYGAMEGRQEYLGIYQQGVKLTPDGIKAIGAMVEWFKPELIYLDGIFDLMAGMDINSATDVADILGRLARATAEWNVATMIARHVGKASVGKASDEQGIGSVMFRNKARGQIVLHPHPTRHGVKVAYDGRGALLKERGLPVAFRRVGRALEWVNLPDAERQELMDAFLGQDGGQTVGKRAGRPSVVEGLRDAIYEALRDGSRPCAEVRADVCASTKCSERSFYQAVRTFGIQSEMGRYSLPAGFDPFEEGQ